MSTFATADPLHMEYAVNPLGGGIFHYDFTLSVDNHDGSWAAGQGFSWLTFGDQPNNTPSNLTNFALDSGNLPVGPWIELDNSSGGHNGPTFLIGTGGGIAYWVPSGVGASLSWHGTSTADLPQGQLLFSTLLTQGGGVPANFDIAHRTTAPEPASMAVLGLGAVAMIRRRVRKSS
jgi:hypothetical protein